MQNYFLLRESLLFAVSDFLSNPLLPDSLSQTAALSPPFRPSEGNQGQAQPGGGWAMRKGSMQRVDGGKGFKGGVWKLCLRKYAWC